MSSRALSGAQFSQVAKAAHVAVNARQKEAAGGPWSGPVDIMLHPDYADNPESVPTEGTLDYAPKMVDNEDFSTSKDHPEYPDTMSTDEEYSEHTVGNMMTDAIDANPGSEKSSGTPVLRIGQGPLNKEEEHWSEHPASHPSVFRVRYSPLVHYPETQKGKSDSLLDVL